MLWTILTICENFEKILAKLYLSKCLDLFVKGNLDTFVKILKYILKYICSADIEGGAVQPVHCPLQLVCLFLTPWSHPQTGFDCQNLKCICRNLKCICRNLKCICLNPKTYLSRILLSSYCSICLLPGPHKP